jgi:predicted RNase H-like HicB family nuclease
MEMRTLPTQPMVGVINQPMTKEEALERLDEACRAVLDARKALKDAEKAKSVAADAFIAASKAEE